MANQIYDNTKKQMHDLLPVFPATMGHCGITSMAKTISMELHERTTTGMRGSDMDISLPFRDMNDDDFGGI